MAAQIGHPASAMAQTSVQRQTRNHCGRTRGHASSGIELRTARLLRSSLADGRGAIGRCLPTGGRHQAEHAHDLFHPQEIEIARHKHQDVAVPVQRGH